MTPKPLMYNTCLEGCTAALSLGHRATCYQASESECGSLHQRGCSDTCAGMEDKVPVPKRFRHCNWGCRAGFNAACALGNSKLEQILDTEWEQMKKKANPHLYENKSEL